jgi:toxin ParE1/3/4
VNVFYRQAARDDLIRQFRYYLLTLDRADVAARFRDAVRSSVALLRQRPRIGAHYRTSDRRLRNIRSWPVQGFEAIRIYYTLEGSRMEVIRILHGSQDIRRILGTQE